MPKNVTPSEVKFLSRSELLALIADLRKENEKKLAELDADAEDGIMDMDNQLETQRAIADTFDLIVTKIEELR